jgi:CheY-like chemotaxis protein
MDIIRQNTNRPAQKILIADDDADVRDILVTRLEANGYEVETAENGVWAVVQARKTKPDLIILDMRMPSGSGESVFDQLKNSIETAFIPVIFVTAYSTPAVRQHMLEIGAAEFIEKPFDSAELLEKVRKVIGANTG